MRFFLFLLLYCFSRLLIYILMCDRRGAIVRERQKAEEIKSILVSGIRYSSKLPANHAEVIMECAPFKGGMSDRRANQQKKKKQKTAEDVLLFTLIGVHRGLETILFLSAFRNSANKLFLGAQLIVSLLEPARVFQFARREHFSSLDNCLISCYFESIFSHFMIF